MAQTDYAHVIEAEDYSQGLTEHPDIPQSDAGIVRIISERLELASGKEFRVLDLGCGPGRITKQIADELVPIAHRKNVRLSITGIDISEGFVSFANTNRSGAPISYILADFLTHEFKQSFDVIVMQGLFHHVPRHDRRRWLEKCRDILAPDAVAVIGDEFIPDYSSEEERVLKVAGLYAYVIAYALQNGNTSLAQIESMNMVDDVCANLPGAGHSNAELIKFIQDTSAQLYSCVYEKGTLSTDGTGLLQILVERIQHDAAEIATSDIHNHNRGDYKISLREQTEELAGIGLSLVGQKIYGPVEWLGGMGVLVFRNK